MSYHLFRLRLTKFVFIFLQNLQPSLFLWLSTLIWQNLMSILVNKRIFLDTKCFNTSLAWAKGEFAFTTLWFIWFFFLITGKNPYFSQVWIVLISIRHAWFPFVCNFSDERQVSFHQTFRWRVVVHHLMI